MSENKVYYWLKLKEDFFEDDTIRWLEEQDNGKDYVLFYLKLCLKSLKSDGNIVRFVGDLLIPYDKKTLARVTNTDIDTVIVAIELFKSIGLIDIKETGEIYLNQINEMVGSETNKAELMRKFRAREKQKMIEGNNVTQMLPQIEKEIEKELDICSDKPYGNDEQVWDYYCTKLKALNKTRKRTEKKLKHIRARLSDGFTVEQLKQVIDSVFSNDFMLGKNDQKKAYVEIDNFMCNTEKVEKWLDSAPIRKPIPKEVYTPKVIEVDDDYISPYQREQEEMYKSQRASINIIEMGDI